ncbi:unnamed protein product [Rhizoctonia solani]|uniref:Sodium/calcium exchanger membrane region domain-containing protein n=1 Tax=Rhizoctonia solani TaxID=456999 RepID=A0A8H3CQA6_9AGAM|nr:unnamed protein product [Rhizoctonia solani]
MSGGFQYFEQGFNIGKVQISCSLLMLGVTIQLLPGVLSFATAPGSPLSPPYNNPAKPYDRKSIAYFTRYVSVAMLIFYCCYWLFQYIRHKLAISRGLGNHTSQTTPSIRYPRDFSPRWLIRSNFLRERFGFDIEEGGGEPIRPESNAPQLKLNIVIGATVLVGSSVFTVYTTQFFWEALQKITDEHEISSEFVGVILIPLVSNIAQVVMFVEMINESVQDNLDVVLDEIIGDSIQMSLLIAPLLVVIGWIMGIPLFLINDPVDSAILFMSVLVLNYVVNDGRSNWFEGIILLTLYTIFAIALWYYPGRNLFVVLEEIRALPHICTIGD